MKILLKKVERGLLSISPIWVFKVNLRRLDVKRKAKYLSWGGRVRRLEAFVNILPAFYRTRLACGPEASSMEVISLTLEAGVFSRGLESWDSKRGCCLAHSSGITWERADKEQEEEIPWCWLVDFMWDTDRMGCGLWPEAPVWLGLIGRVLDLL